MFSAQVKLPVRSMMSYSYVQFLSPPRAERSEAVIITIASHKGGVGKTTTAFHLAAFFQQEAPTLLLDGDETRNATAWSKRGGGVAFRVANEVQAAKLAPQFTHIIIDTGQKPREIDLKALAEGCDLLIIPAVPATLDTEGLF